MSSPKTLTGSEQRQTQAVQRLSGINNHTAAEAVLSPCPARASDSVVVGGVGVVAPADHIKGAVLKAYASQTSKIRQDEMILEFLPMVHKITHQIVSYLHPPLSRDDLISAGTIGLVKAARDYDPTHDAEFKTYAYIRIRGSILDELRGWSFAPSSARKQLDLVQQAFDELAGQKGRSPTDRELAAQLNISVEKMYRIFENARARHFLSIHGLDEDAPALGNCLAATGNESDFPGAGLERAELIEKLADAITGLPGKQRKIIILYYHKELTMKQIAAALGITESRVSQLHAGALFRLSNRLREYDGGGK